MNVSKRDVYPEPTKTSMPKRWCENGVGDFQHHFLLPYMGGDESETRKRLCKELFNVLSLYRYSNLVLESGFSFILNNGIWAKCIMTNEFFLLEKFSTDNDLKHTLYISISCILAIVKHNLLLYLPQLYYTAFVECLWLIGETLLQPSDLTL